MKVKKHEEVMGDSRDYLRLNSIIFKEIKFDIIPKTANDVVNIYGCQLEHVLKTLVFVGKDVVILVLQGDKKVNMKRLESLCEDTKMRMATPKEIKNLFSKDIGSLDHFMRTPKCKKFIDKKIFDQDIVNMGSGIPDIGIEMATDELRKVWDGLIEDISL